VGEFVTWTFLVAGLPLALGVIQQIAGLVGDLVCTKTIIHKSAYCARRMNHRSQW
jgi:hypothetical protein